MSLPPVVRDLVGPMLRSVHKDFPVPVIERPRASASDLWTYSSTLRDPPPRDWPEPVKDTVVKLRFMSDPSREPNATIRGVAADRLRTLESAQGRLDRLGEEQSYDDRKHAAALQAATDEVQRVLRSTERVIGPYFDKPSPARRRQ